MTSSEEWESLGVQISFIDIREGRQVFLSGELDISMRGAQEDKFLKLVTQAPRGLAIVDLSGVSFCDSIGVDVLVKAALQLSEDGGELRLAAVPPWVERTLKMVGAAEVIPAFSTVNEAYGASRDARDW